MYAEQPLVTVICLCYNHERFVEEALLSVLNQTYTQVQMLVVDDGSSDQSVAIIKALALSYPKLHLICNERNMGNCSSFNKALSLAQGKYIIDFATDDVMLPHTIEKKVAFFEQQNEQTGVIYSDAELIDENGHTLGCHHRDHKMPAPSGDIYTHLLRSYFLCPPTMMMRKSVLDELGGYDVSLSYEDFDFWIRSSRNHVYAFQPEVLIKRRVVQNSSSRKNFKKGHEAHFKTTLRVCQKAAWLNRSPEEDKVLAQRIHFELKHAFLMEQFDIVKGYYRLLKDKKLSSFSAKLIYLLSKLRIPMFWAYRIYLARKKKN